MSKEEQEEEENAFEDSVDSGKDEGQLITNFDPQGFSPAIVASLLSRLPCRALKRWSQMWSFTPFYFNLLPHCCLVFHDTH